MADTPTELTGPDLVRGIPAEELIENTPLLGHAGGEQVILVRHAGRVFALGSTCTHWAGPLAEGLVVDGTVRCPWHHTCFSLETGQPVRAPALKPVPVWEVTERDGRLSVGERTVPGLRHRARTAKSRTPESVVIIGGGGAGAAAAQELRAHGYEGPVTIVDPDTDTPYDRPNLSKDYLAGNAPEDWIPLHPASFYEERGIERLRREVLSVDIERRMVVFDQAGERTYGALLLAPGAAPIRLSLEGDDSPPLLYLRTLADTRLIIRQAESAKRAVLLGASFIALEVAASLRARGLEVDVVAPESRLFERVLGGEVGDLVRRVHEDHGVRFHLGRTARAVRGGEVILDDGSRLPADLVVAGVGVRPRTVLAEKAGMAVDNGIVVDRFLRTGAPDVYAAGDAARYPDPRTDELVRIEHWVVAERMGQTAARNMLGAAERYADVPFFWSQHHDMVISYVGHAARWDALTIDGDLSARDCAVRYRRGNDVLAVATIGRDRESLLVEAEMERSIPGAPLSVAHRATAR